MSQSKSSNERWVWLKIQMVCLHTDFSDFFGNWAHSFFIKKSSVPTGIRTPYHLLGTQTRYHLCHESRSGEIRKFENMNLVWKCVSNREKIEFLTNETKFQKCARMTELDFSRSTKTCSLELKLRLFLHEKNYFWNFFSKHDKKHKNLFCTKRKKCILIKAVVQCLALLCL